jgi:hypothetical protein
MAADDSMPVASPEKQNSNYQQKKTPSQMPSIHQMKCEQSLARKLDYLRSNCKCGSDTEGIRTGVRG